MHHIKPSIGVGLKILVGVPLFFPLDGQTKGGVVVGTKGPFKFHSSCIHKKERNNNPLIHYQFNNFFAIKITLK